MEVREVTSVNRAWSGIIAAGCLLLLLGGAAAPVGAEGTLPADTIQVSGGGDSFGPPDGPSSTRTGEFVLVAGSLLGLLFLGAAVLSVLRQAGTDSTGDDHLQDRPFSGSGGEKGEGHGQRRHRAPHRSGSH
ncbi:MAG TPA: hypothetical protein PLY91_04885 [Methanoregulaceae archaeon]|nr:hypothetical protein [Methanoregulaceae archaeon]